MLMVLRNPKFLVVSKAPAEAERRILATILCVLSGFDRLIPIATDPESLQAVHIDELGYCGRNIEGMFVSSG